MDESGKILLSITIAFLFIFPSTKGGPLPNCTYSIEIETTCAPFAGTTNVVGVRFGDSDGNLILVKHLKDPKLVYDPKDGVKKQGKSYGGFERCAIDMFETNGTCLSRWACYLYLKRSGSDEWRPGWVKVLRRREDGSVFPVSYMFYFRIFVPDNVWFGFNYCWSNRGSMPQMATSLGGGPD
ncbi:embryo-specific protein ATS3A-like [Tasmannia lanceolata]|uniref:embryo-specific protein ATS3A-like n=1 Tax=Tasmannia lanceolata TaxID=3420 RepID=UPI0040634D55